MINLSNSTNLSFKGYVVKHNTEEDLKNYLYDARFGDSGSSVHAIPHAPGSEKLLIADPAENKAFWMLTNAANTKEEKDAIVNMFVKDAEVNKRVLDFRA